MKTESLPHEEGLPARLAGSLEAGWLSPPVSSEGAARILVVEDDREMRSMVEEALREEGYDAIGVSDALSALTVLLGEGADVVVTDWKMPARSGLDLLDSLRRCLPALPIIFITAYADPDLRRRALEGGARSFLAKPFLHSDLLAHVRAALVSEGERRARRGRERS